ncbi:MAG: hypothetical protein GY874_17160 [Desulfobacteraceae bacterium]|nr:hypothetical protein [Desulfobacteraceae bacterium]
MTAHINDNICADTHSPNTHSTKNQKNGDKISKVVPVKTNPASKATTANPALLECQLEKVSPAKITTSDSGADSLASSASNLNRFMNFFFNLCGDSRNHPKQNNVTEQQTSHPAPAKERTTNPTRTQYPGGGRTESALKSAKNEKKPRVPLASPEAATYGSSKTTRSDELPPAPAVQPGPVGLTPSRRDMVQTPPDSRDVEDEQQTQRARQLDLEYRSVSPEECISLSKVSDPKAVMKQLERQAVKTRDELYDFMFSAPPSYKKKTRTKHKSLPIPNQPRYDAEQKIWKIGDSEKHEICNRYHADVTLELNRSHFDETIQLEPIGGDVCVDGFRPNARGDVTSNCHGSIFAGGACGLRNKSAHEIKEVMFQPINLESCADAQAGDVRFAPWHTELCVGHCTLDGKKTPLWWSKMGSAKTILKPSGGTLVHRLKNLPNPNPFTGIGKVDLGDGDPGKYIDFSHKQVVPIWQSVKKRPKPVSCIIEIIEKLGAPKDTGNIVSKITDYMTRYYKYQRESGANRDTNDPPKYGGEFDTFCSDSGFECDDDSIDDDSIYKELQYPPEECVLMEFDENFPYPTSLAAASDDDKQLFIYVLLRHAAGVGDMTTTSRR